jgi:hypothetical protein
VHGGTYYYDIIDIEISYDKVKCDTFTYTTTRDPHALPEGARHALSPPPDPPREIYTPNAQ